MSRRSRLSTLAALGLTAGAPAVWAQAPAFALQTTPPGLTAAPYMSAPAAADFDGDGDLDVLAGRSDGTLAYFENTAGAGAAPAYAERAGAQNPMDGVNLGFAAAPAAADLDGDGDLDLLVGRGDGTFAFYRNTAAASTAPTFAADALFAGLADVGANSIPAVADLDGDGDLDVLAGRSDGTLAYFENTAGAGAAPAYAERAGAQNPLGAVDVGFSSAPRIADLDGDGDLDVLVGEVHGLFHLAENTAGPGAPPAFAAPVAGPFGLGDAGYASVPAVADVDRDGDLDVLAGVSTGAYAYYADGAPDPLAVRLAGTDGWRMLTAPVGSAPLAAFLDPIWTQGVPGADYAGGSPNVLRYDESVTTDTDGSGDHSAGDGYVPPASMGEAVGAGRGLLVYVYADDDFGTPGTQGGFPKTLAVTGAPRTTPFTWGAAGTGADAPLTFTPTGDALADGWNLLGNPFASWLDWDATGATGLDAAVYVYDPAVTNYRTYSRGVGGSLTGGVVGAFQGFFAHATAAGARLTAAPAPADGGPVYGRADAALTRIHLALRPAGGGPAGIPTTARSEVLLALGVEGATPALDPFDAYALTPPAPGYVLLATRVAAADGTPVGLAVDARPAPDGPVSVALDVAAVAAGAPVGGGGGLVLEWPAADGLPPGWTARLLDHATGAVLALDASGTYAFEVAGGEAPPARSAGAAGEFATVPIAGTPTVVRAGTTGRFELVVSSVTTGTTGALPTAFALSPPQPNPASGHATLTLDLPAAADVTAALYDALGRRVAVLAEGPQGAGRLPLTVETGALPAGIYLVRVVVRGASAHAFVQRLSVAR